MASLDNMTPHILPSSLTRHTTISLASLLGPASALMELLPHVLLTYTAATTVAAAASNALSPTAAGLSIYSIATGELLRVALPIVLCPDAAVPAAAPSSGAATYEYNAALMGTHVPVRHQWRFAGPAFDQLQLETFAVPTLGWAPAAVESVATPRSRGLLCSSSLSLPLSLSPPPSAFGHSLAAVACPDGSSDDGSERLLFFGSPCSSAGSTNLSLNSALHLSRSLPRLSFHSEALCATLLDATTLALLGASPRCSIAPVLDSAAASPLASCPALALTRARFTVVLGAGATVTPGDTARFAAPLACPGCPLATPAPPLFGAVLVHGFTAARASAPFMPTGGDEASIVGAAGAWEHVDGSLAFERFRWAPPAQAIWGPVDMVTPSPRVTLTGRAEVATCAGAAAWHIVTSAQTWTGGRPLRSVGGGPLCTFWSPGARAACLVSAAACYPVMLRARCLHVILSYLVFLRFSFAGVLRCCCFRLVWGRSDI